MSSSKEQLGLSQFPQTIEKPQKSSTSSIVPWAIALGLMGGGIVGAISNEGVEMIAVPILGICGATLGYLHDRRRRLSNKDGISRNSDLK